ncbi:conserved hypothetical protein [Streptomyces scabiei 87.22]|uniref:Transposase n=1 Tax=Streptomyces scabiei (strain 87.22) TaxID=680198 RepID=C9Z9Q4_STRSW|nr:conserved hypothetical protein [Streptomyces scabiei 87.22]
MAMRYAQGGGLTPQGQAAREQVRMLAADCFARDEKNVVIAKRLRVSVRSVERWRRSWREGWRQALFNHHFDAQTTDVGARRSTTCITRNPDASLSDSSTTGRRSSNSPHHDRTASGRARRIRWIRRSLGDRPRGNGS